MTIKIIRETLENYKEVEAVIESAFKNAEHTDHKEQFLVERLRKSDEFVPELSLIATDNDKIIGHIMFTKVIIKDINSTSESLALAPLAVIPEYQSKGIGGRIIKEGLEIAKNLGYKSVIVLGHDKYYPKFGFERASIYDIKAPFEVPDTSFMALELEENSLKSVSGVVEYSKAFFE